MTQRADDGSLAGYMQPILRHAIVVVGAGNYKRQHMEEWPTLRLKTLIESARFNAVSRSRGSYLSIIASRRRLKAMRDVHRSRFLLSAVVSAPFLPSIIPRCLSMSGTVTGFDCRADIMTAAFTSVPNLLSLVHTGDYRKRRQKSPVWTTL